MCGFVGVFDSSGANGLARTVRRATARLAHRGPDDEGFHFDGPVGLGHRRLSIIDLSAAAHQPMTGEAGVVLVYNGEIYNFRELRRDLEASGCAFASRSDTEVVLRAYERWGVDCVRRFNGHFALAVWDAPGRTLFLARDRYGVKPLYWTFDGRRLVFASEVKAILEWDRMPRAVSPTALNEYFTFQNVLSDVTLFEGIRLLPPGCTLTFDTAARTTPVQRRYWDFSFPEPLKIDDTDAERELVRLFSAAVERQLVSDVPLASYLSGGMDSGSIAAVARRRLGRMATFTMGFDLSSASGLELGYDERAASEMLANLLKTEHYEMVLHAGDMEHVMPELIAHLEELRVGQCYPNYYMARLASKFVKVVLSGVGGDELFGGYPWRYYRGLKSRNENDFQRNYYDFWQRLVPDEEKPQLFHKQLLAKMGGHSTFDVFCSVLQGVDVPFDRPEGMLNASLYFELKTFLHGILMVEDKVSMAHSMESRVPFLDDPLVEFALSLPPRLKLRNVAEAAPATDEDDVGKRHRHLDGKWILRRAMRDLLPAEVIERPKQGFSAPDASWFRGESIDYVNRLLRARDARINEYLEPVFVVRKLDEHTSGRTNHRLLIWSLLSLEWWLRTFLP
ncbi:MAG TPA: asparagine synthase (glutamine-hydrolyzing) [Vicinamibacterales bacterium]|nr:asparagine synthase (glutamine-hydrolyzing) [Vicinamibacterales bacterium]